MPPGSVDTLRPTFSPQAVILCLHFSSVQDSGLDSVRPGPSQVPLGTHTALPCTLQGPQQSVRAAQGPGPQTLPLFQPPALIVTKTQGWAPPHQLCKRAPPESRGQSVIPLWAEDSWGTPDPIGAFQELQGHCKGSKSWLSATHVTAEENERSQAGGSAVLLE